MKRHGSLAHSPVQKARLRRPGAPAGKRGTLYQPGDKHAPMKPGNASAAAEVEMHILKHPALPVPLKEIANRHGANIQTLEVTVARIRKFHGIKPARTGRILQPFRAYEIILEAFKKAKPNQTIVVFDVIRRIWRETGVVVIYETVTDNIRRMDKAQKKKKSLKFSTAGVRDSSELGFALKGSSALKREFEEAKKRFRADRKA